MHEELFQFEAAAGYSLLVPRTQYRFTGNMERQLSPGERNGTYDPNEHLISDEAWGEHGPDSIMDHGYTKRLRV